MEAIKIEISLKKLHTTITLEELTGVTKERLDVETSVDKDLLDKIIRKQVATKIQKSNNALGQLKK